MEERGTGHGMPGIASTHTCLNVESQMNVIVAESQDCKVDSSATYTPVGHALLDTATTTLNHGKPGIASTPASLTGNISCTLNHGKPGIASTPARLTGNISYTTVSDTGR